MSGTPHEDTLPQTVNEIINQDLTKTTDAKGKWTGAFSGLDELEISDDKKDAVRSEMRRRHTDQTYTRNNQELIEAKAEVKALKKLLPQNPNMSEEEKKELDTLKYSDPDAWLIRMTEGRSDGNKIIDDTLAEARSTATRTNEIDRRAKVLEDFNVSNPDNPLTDDQLQQDIPPRLIAQVENGSITFDEMLVKAHSFINGSKKIDNPDYSEEPSFDKKPSGKGSSDKVVDSAYENMKF